MLERPQQHPHAFDWMDLLRTGAALLVAISHLRDMLWRDASPLDGLGWKLFYFLTGFGHIGVVVFFVLSGFWITRSTMKRIDRPDFWPSYLIDRTSRLWLVLLPVLIIGGVIDYLGSHYLQAGNYLATSGMHSISRPVASQIGLIEFIGSALFLTDIVTMPLGSNGPLWSLAYEFWYYLWFPALALAVTRRKLSVSIVVLGIALFSGDLLFGFISWLAGSALYFLLQHLREARVRRWEQSAFLASIAVFGALLAIARVVQAHWMDPLLATAFAAFLLGLCRCNPALPAFLRPLATFGSNSSFSLYALHFPLAMAIVALLTNGERQPPSLLLLAQTCGIMAGIVAVAFVFSRFTEARTDLVRAAFKRRILKANAAPLQDARSSAQ